MKALLATCMEPADNKDLGCRGQTDSVSLLLVISHYVGRLNFGTLNVNLYLDWHECMSK